MKHAITAHREASARYEEHLLKLRDSIAVKEVEQQAQRHTQRNFERQAIVDRQYHEATIEIQALRLQLDKVTRAFGEEKKEHAGTRAMLALVSEESAHHRLDRGRHKAPTRDVAVSCDIQQPIFLRREWRDLSQKCDQLHQAVHCLREELDKANRQNMQYRSMAHMATRASAARVMR
eukprot:GEMP01066061.1.p1 GENE.GEMP01066061.1~~GEMP01066061.1.p1  ORF type:complete len:177 (+),score=56.98 GEMP01066061.1:150-680(+)